MCTILSSLCFSEYFHPSVNINVFINGIDEHVCSHVNSRYVAPEYANTGLLNERSDVYSFGVLLLETVTGRDPVDYGRPSNEVCLSDLNIQLLPL